MYKVLKSWAEGVIGLTRGMTDDELHAVLARPFVGSPGNPYFDLEKFSANAELRMREIEKEFEKEREEIIARLSDYRK